MNMTWSPIYKAYVVMMLPILAVVALLIHDRWKRKKEFGHGKRT